MKATASQQEKAKNMLLGTHEIKYVDVDDSIAIAGMLFTWSRLVPIIISSFGLCGLNMEWGRGVRRGTPDSRLVRMFFAALSRYRGRVR